MNRKNSVYRNGEGYYSPTEGEALSHIIHEERVAARRERIKNAKYVEAWRNPLPYDGTKDKHHNTGRKKP